MENKNEMRPRYQRQILMSEIGPAGQAALQRGSVFILGAGGLGSAAALYLAAAGVGRLGIADADCVEESNLNRQILHSPDTLGMPKTWSAAETIRRFNPEVTLELFAEYVRPETLPGMIGTYDFVIDAADNFPSKYMISDVCVQARRAFSHAGVMGWEGQTFTYTPSPRHGCLRCLLPRVPEGASGPAPILGAIAGMMGTLQAVEAVKYLIGRPELLCNRLLAFDMRRMDFRILPFGPSRDCEICRGIGA